MRSEDSSVILELGTIAHKCYELKYRYIIDGFNPNYELIEDMFMKGIQETTDKDSEGKFLNGISQLKEKYGVFTFGVKCDKSGMNYNDKVKLCLDTIKTEQMDINWKPIAVEKNFEFVYNNKYIIHGFIDRIDQSNEGNIRIVDYKTSKSIYDAKKLTTPLQMVIYAMASIAMYQNYPSEFVYDFIFLNQKQNVKPEKLLDKGLVKLDKILCAIEGCKDNQEYAPNPTPLCFWCEFCSNNPHADKNTKHICDYYSCWTPAYKNFRVNKDYVAGACNKKVVNNPFKF
jgi:hypothetical protein